MERRENLVLEGDVMLGEDGYPTFLDGDALGGFLFAHFDPQLKYGFYSLGRMRITLQPLEGSE